MKDRANIIFGFIYWILPVFLLVSACGTHPLLEGASTPSMTNTQIIPSSTQTPTATSTLTPRPTPTSTSVARPDVKLVSVTFIESGAGCLVDIEVEVTNGPVTGNFYVENDQFSSIQDIFPETTLQTGTNMASSFSRNNIIALGVAISPEESHEIWFKFDNGRESNRLTNLLCPGTQ
ncbi:MAG TPA: hypothetical protein DCX53_02720 [Anaerolineae bacterium]|nr:hypothetical protein [Anaerolineae bacterium]